MLAVQVVVHALCPPCRLQHHNVALRAVKLRFAAVGILIAVRIIQWVVRHLAVRVVHHRVHTRYLHRCCRRHLCYLRQHSVPQLQYRFDVAARLVRRAVLVARPVVKVAHVCIVAHRIVKLYHRVLRLHQPQLVTDPCSQPLIGRLVHASRQSVFAFQHGMVHHRSVVIHTLHPGLHHRHQVSPVTVHVNVSHTQRPHVRALRIDALPFQSRTTVKDEGRHVLAVLHLQSFRRQLWQIFQSQRCQRTRQPQLLQRSALCHRHALHRRASRVQLLQQRLASEVQHRRVLTITPRVRLSLQIHLSQLAAAARHEPPRRY